MIFLWITGGIAALDLCLKNAIEKREDSDFPREIKESWGLIKLYKNHNQGFSFGGWKEYPELVKMIPLVITSGLAGAFVWLLPRKGQWVAKMGMAITLGGAVSNLYDRLVRGYVVDYFSIQWRQLKKVILNLGDVCIVLGTAILFFHEMMHTYRE